MTFELNRRLANSFQARVAYTLGKVSVAGTTLARSTTFGTPLSSAGERIVQLGDQVHVLARQAAAHGYSGGQRIG